MEQCSKCGKELGTAIESNICSDCKITILKNFIARQEDIDPEITDLVNEHFWELFDSKTVNSPPSEQTVRRVLELYNNFLIKEKIISPNKKDIIQYYMKELLQMYMPEATKDILNNWQEVKSEHNEDI